MGKRRRVTKIITRDELKNSIEKALSGDESEVPPYMTPQEWLTQLSLQVDELDYPLMIWCKECNTYHSVQMLIEEKENLK